MGTQTYSKHELKREILKLHDFVKFKININTFHSKGMPFCLNDVLPSKNDFYRREIYKGYISRLVEEDIIEVIGLAGNQKYIFMCKKKIE